MAFCSNCGTPAVENAKFCSGCGCPIEAPSVEPIVAEPVAEPIAEPVAEPVAEPIAEPVVEPIAEPVAEPIVAEPVVEEPAVTEKREEEPVVEPVFDTRNVGVDENTGEEAEADKAEATPRELKPITSADTDCGWIERKVSTMYYIGICLLYSLPVIGLVASIILSLKDNKTVSKQNFAKAVLVFKIAGLVLLLAAGIAALVLNKEILEMINDILGENYRSWEQLFNAYEWK